MTTLRDSSAPQTSTSGFGLSLRCVSGEAIVPWLDQLARLRIEVFREWPYLYDGDLAYERDYLQAYGSGEASVVVLALDDACAEGGELIGASSGLPLIHADKAFQAPFEDQPDLLNDIFYFGESVLAADYRGKGLGQAFFNEREEHARRQGFERAVFCAVQRSVDHPRRPAHSRDLTSFWCGRGYLPIPSGVTSFSWLDIGESMTSRKPMQFWAKCL